MKILVTGAGGQLGFDLVKELNQRGHGVCCPDSKELDITDPEAVRTVLTALRPDAVMHCAGYTAVDNAEDDQERCDLVNVIGTENIARTCTEIGAKLLYISTDYVFPGTGETPWETDDATAPLNVYGKSKFLGEEAVRRYVPEHFIVRISWLFGLRGKNFVKTMLRLGAERETLTVVCDQIGSPTYTGDLARLLADMIVTDRYGTYHATNEGFCSWYEFACAIMEKAGLPAKVLPVTSAEYAAKAARPFNSRLSKRKLAENGFDRLPGWQDALERYLKELENETK